MTPEQKALRNAHRRASYANNPYSRVEQNRRYKEKHREKVLEKARAYAKQKRLAEGGAARAKDKERREANKPEIYERTRRWYQQHPEYVNEYRLRRLEAHLLKSAKSRAKTYDIPFDITEADIVIPDICPALGIPLDRAGKKGVFNSLTLDKIIPELGYVRGNVQVVSCRANRLKSDATAEELEALAAYVRRVRP
jgi:hypothetical protein